MEGLVGCGATHGISLAICLRWLGLPVSGVCTPNDLGMKVKFGGDGSTDAQRSRHLEWSDTREN